MIALPRALSAGSRVALIAPSSPATDEKLERAVRGIASLGFEPVVGASCFGATPERGYLASDCDATKIEDIHWAFSDSSIDGIICIRGGSGAGRLIRHLDAGLIASRPKVFVGYSDITILHSFIARNCGFVTFHGPMATTDDIFSDGSPTGASLLRAITDPAPLGEIGNPDVSALQCLSPGRCSGTLAGGNLALLCTTIGTIAEVDTKDKVVLIEDVDEEPYSVDRMLNHLLNAGKLADCAGIVLGSFTDCEPPEQYPSRTLDVVFRDVLLPLGVPIISGLDTGHDKINLTLPLGVEVFIDADRGKMLFPKPALST